ncbi:spermatogenesis- and oogenesis-specific basic helix-loop-helix-containing protein 1 [Choloepus didactylus]|uniref:spermatogenesis- and oogenesis-specific basic helix-loop-helix-containing protein 1 n=1 Tax=Choloepus didactylus TaxID=27675 RepID=UPI00189EEA48|nr:spermatogenesis- and oogenesis-specific basic helix-loop-helix-containing protein 1 [Choloepus didactylus]
MASRGAEPGGGVPRVPGGCRLKNWVAGRGRRVSRPSSSAQGCVGRARAPPLGPNGRPGPAPPSAALLGHSPETPWAPGQDRAGAERPAQALLPPSPQPPRKKPLPGLGEPGGQLGWSPVSCSGPSRPGALAGGDHPAPAAPGGQGSCRRRNVLTERERRKRISASCERLRALLPRFDGRREDMASVLEMAVQFLQLSHALVPSEEQPVILVPAKDVGQKRPKPSRQSALGGLRPAGALGPGSGVLALMAQQDTPRCASAGEDKSEGPSGLAEVLGGRLAPPGPSSLAPVPSDLRFSRAPEARAPTPLPRWPTLSQRPASPPASPEAQSWPGQAGSPGRGPAPLGGPAEEADGDTVPVLDGRPASRAPVDDDTPFLLTAGPDWWLGSLEGRGGGVPSPPAGRSSPLERAEPAFPADPEPGFQELQDSLLAQWGSDLGCSGLALREEADGSFPDFFACCL